MEAESYHRRVIDQKGYNDDRKMLIIWDVYVRHRDQDLLDWIEGSFSHIIVLFIPANLTEICQPLDLYFNAKFKMIYAWIRNKDNAIKFHMLFQAEQERANDKDSGASAHTDTANDEHAVMFHSPTKLTEIKTIF